MTGRSFPRNAPDDRPRLGRAFRAPGIGVLHLYFCQGRGFAWAVTQWPGANLVLCVPGLAVLRPEGCGGPLRSLAGQQISANHSASTSFVNDYHIRVADRLSCWGPGVEFAR